MRIGFVTELFHPHIGGCERRFLEIGKRLSRLGNEVHVFTSRYDEKLPKEDSIDRIQIHRYARGYLKGDGSRSLFGVINYSFLTPLKLKSYGEFDVIYFNQWPLLHSLCSFTFPIVQEWCEVWFDRIVFLERVLKHVSDWHVAVSDFTKRRMIDFLRINPESITIIPNGVDYKRLSEGSHKKKWGKIVYVGRLTPHKHVELLLEAFRHIRQKLDGVELHIVGSGPLLPLIRRRAARVDGCFVYGFLRDEDMVKILKDSWLFVIPSEREGSGITTLEALAMGIPVVTADFPNNAIKETLAYGNGLVAKPTSRDLASTIYWLFDRDGEWKEMSRSARSFAMKFDWNTITSMMESLFRELNGNKK